MHSEEQVFYTWQRRGLVSNRPGSVRSDDARQGRVSESGERSGIELVINSRQEDSSWRNEGSKGQNVALGADFKKAQALSQFLRLSARKLLVRRSNPQP